MLVFQQPLGSRILAVWFGTQYQTCWHVVSSRAHLTNEKKKKTAWNTMLDLAPTLIQKRAKITVSIYSFNQFSLIIFFLLQWNHFVFSLFFLKKISLILTQLCLNEVWMDQTGFIRVNAFYKSWVPSRTFFESSQPEFNNHTTMPLPRIFEYKSYYSKISNFPYTVSIS